MLISFSCYLQGAYPQCAAHLPPLPYLAVQALQQTANDFGDKFTLAKLRHSVMDDCLAGADSPENAIKTSYKQLSPLEFDLCKEIKLSNTVFCMTSP